MRNIAIRKIKKNGTYFVSSNDGIECLYSDNNASEAKAEAFRRQAKDLGMILTVEYEDEHIRSEVYAYC